MTTFMIVPPDICASVSGLWLAGTCGRLWSPRASAPDRQHPSAGPSSVRKARVFPRWAAHAERLLVPLWRQESGAYQRLTWTRPWRSWPTSTATDRANAQRTRSILAIPYFKYARAADHGRLHPGLGTRQVFPASSQDRHKKLAELSRARQPVHSSLPTLSTRMWPSSSAPIPP